MAQEVLHAAAVSLFQYNTATQSYEGRGQVGAAITGDGSVYKLVCYENQQSYICTATIGSNNDTLKFQLKQTENYAGFRDDNGQQWSLYFSEENNALMFAMHVVLAIYGGAGMPTHAITSIDLSEISGDTVDVNDSVGVKFNAYYVGSEKGRPTLSYQFDSNIQSKHTYRFQIPTSNTNLTPDCKGFEGAVCGMCQGSRRCLVIPAACRRGTTAGGAGTVIVIVDVRKVKKEDNPPQNQMQMQMQMQQSQPHMQSMQAGNFHDFQQQQKQQQPVAMLTMSGQMQPMQLPVAQPVVQQAAPMQAAPAPAPTPAPAAAAGLTIEQLRTVNDTAQNVTTLITNVSEISQKVDLLTADFKMAQKQQKPTTLTAAQLQHSVTAMLDENKQLKDEVKAKDDMIKTLEQRCLDLEKKVDKFAQSAHSLMEEKKSAATSASDVRLEMDRRVLKLQEELQRANSERDDSQRHLATVKKLLEISEDEIRKLKGENEITKVQTENTRMKISHTEDSLKSEKDSRRLAEERILQLSSELSEARDTLQRKEAALNEKTRKIESDRVHFNNLIEEERSHAEKEMTSMRDEMLVDLQSREKRFMQEKERAAEDAYSRGLDQGKDEGLAEARMRYEEEMGKLRANAMAAEGELQSQISRLKVDIENNMVEIEGLKKTVLEVTTDLSDATDKLTLRQAELDLEKEKSSTLNVSHEAEMSALNEKISETTARLQKEMIQTEVLTEKLEDCQRKLSEAEVRWTTSLDSLTTDSVPLSALKVMCQDIFLGKTPDLSFEEEAARHSAQKAPTATSPREEDDDWSVVAKDVKKDSESDDLVKVEHQVEEEEPKHTEPPVEEKEEEEQEEKAEEPSPKDSSDDEEAPETKRQDEQEEEEQEEEEAKPEAEPEAEEEQPAVEEEKPVEPEAAEESEEEVKQEDEPEAEPEREAEPEQEVEKEEEEQEKEKEEEEKQPSEAEEEPEAKHEEEAEPEPTPAPEPEEQQEEQETEAPGNADDSASEASSAPAPAPVKEEEDDLPVPGESLPAVAAPATDEPLPAPPVQSEASPTAKKKSFFDSDTDSSDDEPPRPAPKSAAPPPPKKGGGLFDSSDSDSD
eukprot:TRINITY_DN106_c1_g1_i1.p1 TRINITY_DN106_c1_g1~~TRINITY_DN106_c1_g1_i1.p1  ORF type:complete len:1093 (+),score=476.10 TRINITY_DN106_c1_g1_i1:128-3406(+)